MTLIFDPYSFDPALAHGKLEKVTQVPFVCEAKLDGVRQILSRVGGECFLTGRRTSSKTGFKLNKIDWVPDIKAAVLTTSAWWNVVLDGELYIKRGTSNEVVSIIGSAKEKAWEKQKTQGALHYRVFDVLVHDGKDMRDHPYSARRELLKYLLTNCISTPYIESVPVFYDTSAPDALEGSGTATILSSCFDMALSKGFEGLVVKSLNGSYNSKEWAKVKAQNTYDYVICGVDESTSDTYSGWGIAALVLGLYNSAGSLVELTRCSGLTEAWRREFFDNRDKYYCQVVEVTAQQQFETGALRHPRFTRLRPDVSATEQTFLKYSLRE